MKKVIFRFMSIAMIISLVMTSCSKDEEKEELALSQLSVIMVHDDTVTVFANQKATFLRLTHLWLLYLTTEKLQQSM